MKATDFLPSTVGWCGITLMLLGALAFAARVLRERQRRIVELEARLLKSLDHASDTRERWANYNKEANEGWGRALDGFKQACDELIKPKWTYVSIRLHGAAPVRTFKRSDGTRVIDFGSSVVEVSKAEVVETIPAEAVAIVQAEEAAALVKTN